METPEGQSKTLCCGNSEQNKQLNSCAKLKFRIQTIQIL